MEADWIYHKTDKGLEAVQHRAHRIAPRLRQVLIMVNGEKTVDMLKSELAPLGDIGAMLGQLEQDGFIVHDWPETLVPPTFDPDAPIEAPVVEPPVFDFDRFRGTVAKAILDVLGPLGASQLESLSRARTMEELDAVIPRCARAIERSNGRDRAEAFLDAVAKARRIGT